MQITSPAFDHKANIPAKYSYKGGNVSPPLNFSDIPKNAKSLALICHDPDAPRADGFTHWVVWNILPDVSGFKEGELPNDVVVGVSDFDMTVWGGPEPPMGTHRYNFYLYALDTVLDLPINASRTELETAMGGHTISNAELTGLYSANTK